MKLVRKLVFVTALLLFLLLVLAFPFGPLFPWSPLKQGYQTVSYARGDVFVTKAQPVETDFTMLDRFMDEAERFHQLRFKRRVKVIMCKDWGTCKRALPWMNVNGIGGVTFATGDVIYLTPKLKEKNFSLAEYLRHELSHALIFQNTTVLNAFKLNDQPWFNEGVAVSFGRQRSYLSRAEWLAKAQTDGLAQYLDPALRPAEWNARFAYPTQRYFIEWLKATYGNELFQRFLTRNIAAPDAWRATFAAVYPLAFGDAAQHYEQAARAGKWLPAE